MRFRSAVTLRTPRSWLRILRRLLDPHQATHPVSPTQTCYRHRNVHQNSDTFPKQQADAPVPELGSIAPAIAKRILCPCPSLHDSRISFRLQHFIVLPSQANSLIKWPPKVGSSNPRPLLPQHLPLTLPQLTTLLTSLTPGVGSRVKWDRGHTIHSAAFKKFTGYQFK